MVSLQLQIKRLTIRDQMTQKLAIIGDRTAFKNE